MKIQYIFYNNPDIYPPIVNSSRVLSQQGYHVDILCREYGRHWNVAYPAAVRVRRLKKRARSSWQEYLQFVIKVLRTADKSATIIVGHDMHGFLAAKLLAARLRRPLAYHCHDYVERNASLSMGGRVARAFEQRYARTADLVIVPDADRAKIMAHELRLKKPLLIVANAPLSAASGTKQGLAETLAQQGKSFEKIVLRQGRIGEGHAIEVTLQSLKQWQNPKWGFVLIGHAEPAYLDKIAKLARSLGVEEQFAVLPPVGYDQVAGYTAGADVGHALYEPIHINHATPTTSSNKVMEYIAAGLPLLVSENPSLRTFVDHYQCGVVADEKSPESVAAAVNSLLSDEKKMRQMGAAGRKAFLDVFSYEKQFTPVIELMQQLISAR